MAVVAVAALVAVGWNFGAGQAVAVNVPAVGPRAPGIGKPGPGHPRRQRDGAAGILLDESRRHRA